jgi:uncharacterized protein
MKLVLADASYWVAILNKNDRLNVRAVEASKRLGNVRMLTTEMILTEILNYFCQRGRFLRAMAGEMVDAMRNNPNLEIEPQTTSQFQMALALYRASADKGWSLTDCASFTLMRERGITTALTEDQHFVQAGFISLLQEGNEPGT